MRIRRFLLLALLLLGLLAACGSSGPAGVAREWFKALSTGEGGEALKLTCRASREDLHWEAGGIRAASCHALGTGTGAAAMPVRGQQAAQRVPTGHETTADTLPVKMAVPLRSASTTQILYRGEANG